ncbi:catalytic subunit of the PKA [Tirmania nivea]|nr:catalytic subunit of the PKA [Tirmania nivea]
MPALGFLKKKKKDKESQRSKESNSTSSSILQKEEQQQPVEEPPTPTVPTASSQANNISEKQQQVTVSQNNNPTPTPFNPPILPPPEPMALVSDRPMLSEQGQYQSAPVAASQPHKSNINSLINPPQQNQDYPRYYDSNAPQQQQQAQQQAGQQNASQPETQQSQAANTSNGSQQTPSMNTESNERQPQQAQVQTRSTKGKYSLLDFTIQRTLGTGSFGRVHLVQSRHNLRFYAVKVLKKAQVVKMKQVEHTNDERKMLQKVKHPFLITLWGTFQDPKNLYMVMDFIEGGELFSLLRKTHQFPNPVAKFYAAEVTLALEYLHSLHIIYRDLKPENLLLDRHGHLKITDFGFAKEVPDITWTLCGTPDYLAPEVVSSRGYNKSVDWWSLGILIFEMLCGYTPFYDSGSPMRIYENILSGNPRYPPHIHPDAKDLLVQLITPDLTKRLGNLLHGSDDIKNHAWFAEVNWERLAKRDIEAPYVPPVRGGVGDASQFDRYPEDPEEYGVNDGVDQYGHLFGDF